VDGLSSHLFRRVRTEVGDAPLHGGLVFFWSSYVAIVGCEFKIRPRDDHRNPEDAYIQTEKIGIVSGLREGAFPGASLRFCLYRPKVEPIDTDRF
jgi:hypothetical protein